MIIFSRLRRPINEDCLSTCLVRGCGTLALAVPADAQVTTGTIAGKVQNAKQENVAGASVIAIHLPSGTSYEATTRADGRFQINGVRVGGPYSVTVAYTGGGGGGLRTRDAGEHRGVSSASPTT